MSSRDAILSKLRAAGRVPEPLPEVPLFDEGLPPVLDQFKASLARMGGQWVDAPAEGLDAWLGQRFAGAQVVCSAVPETMGTLRIATVTDPRALENVDVGIVRARFAVAETGSVWLSEAEYGVNSLGYLAQHLVVLLDPAAILPNLHHAYRQAAFADARYCALVTGPSATADIEGVLIRGAQGVRTLTVVALATPR
ncbi:L-lactate dehydrogenase complex protein LldG [Silvimonas terrae]|uniref:L-lactate dehydrogenase complex protein LldG n=1 Tax=Silvimonas terrae TaxID=300266 RepID=A0A840RBB6_9NEIS|nr:LUD domain-containing protein [Silvimonas terrae]MBB5189828.1 L-lactate dehydrogenase complex protein LldG [Silvimonas terrae]